MRSQFDPRRLSEDELVKLVARALAPSYYKSEHYRGKRGDLFRTKACDKARRVLKVVQNFVASPRCKQDIARQKKREYDRNRYLMRKRKG